jgi:hypothetical protein
MALALVGFLLANPLLLPLAVPLLMGVAVL